MSSRRGKVYYTYDQNNSGGSFTIDDSVCEVVIIEADTAEQANAKAETIGIYFDGVDKGIDCPCCGDSWVREYGKGTDEPEVYGKSVYEFKGSLFRKQAYIYHLDGTKEVITW
ncbi:hypothetical protein M5W78_21025 [Paenibacillus larvae]|uniref:DUF7296 family protein n=1 Tax=Paenibacillus larvae TaxID=1464 RepID=UPI002281190F|nr:hypothetical protein [Paenibacillus larvae]MCY9512341.1 hypothetical protein [Paenibacillus larvae]